MRQQTRTARALMGKRAGPDEDGNKFWLDFLTRGPSIELRLRKVLTHLPGGPRCKLCAAPFSGIGGPMMRAIGKRPSNVSPSICQTCVSFLQSHRGGAEVPCSLLFADIRGSTTMAERMTPTEYRAIAARFYATATKAVFSHDGELHQFVGDQLVALFIPLLAGEQHAARAVETALSLLRETGHADAGGPWLPIGAGVHTGPTWLGAVGDDDHVDLSAFGDSMNITARLASTARAGEILVTAEAAAAARLDSGWERRQLALKGRHAPTEVVSLQVPAPT
ncbi:MAG TPA: adenylate/guanylate cyclase domain-containing protein [Coriobacteriia bacterium]|nr:adenylate/guanylate cyclase domain-containing protein [Coriobacteriia bacterium]